MLDFLHDANDVLGSTLLFVGLVLAWIIVIVFIADEIIGLFIKEEEPKKSQEDTQDGFTG